MNRINILRVDPFFGLLMVVIVTGLIAAFALKPSAKEEKETYNITITALEKWNNFKENNCTIKQKLFSEPISYGKYTYNVNKEVYSCSDGIEYIVVEGLDSKIKNGILSISDIPTIKD